MRCFSHCSLDKATRQREWTGFDFTKLYAIIPCCRLATNSVLMVWPACSGVFLQRRFGHLLLEQGLPVLVLRRLEGQPIGSTQQH